MWAKRKNMELKFCTIYLAERQFWILLVWECCRWWVDTNKVYKTSYKNTSHGSWMTSAIQFYMKLGSWATGTAARKEGSIEYQVNFQKLQFELSFFSECHGWIRLYDAIKNTTMLLWGLKHRIMMKIHKSNISQP